MGRKKMYSRSVKAFKYWRRYLCPHGNRAGSNIESRNVKTDEFLECRMCKRTSVIILRGTHAGA